MLQLLSFPGQFAHMRRVDSIDLVVEIMLTAIVGIWMLTAQAAIVFLWKLVAFAEADQFFSVPSLRWMERLLTALKVALALPVLLFLVLAPEADDPGFFVLLTAITLFIFTLTLFASLLRDQMEKAVPSGQVNLG
jgi:hypothetical protein